MKGENEVGGKKSREENVVSKYMSDNKDKIKKNKKDEDT